MQYRFKKVFIILALVMIALTSFTTDSQAQIFEPEGISMPGAWDSGFANPPNVDNLRTGGSNYSSPGNIIRRTFGGGQYVTTLNVQAAGGDIVGGTHDFKFSSGPEGNPWNNNWGDAGTVTIDAINNLNIGGGSANNTITVANGNHYTFNWEDSGYSNTRFSVMQTTNAPIDIVSVTDNSLTPTITLNVAKSPEERIMVRYTTNSFTTSFLVEATGSGTAYSATIPDPGVTVQYYAFTTTITNDTTLASDTDLYTLRFNNNGGSNYFFGVPVPTVTLVPQNSSPTSETAITYDVTFSDNVNGVTQGAFNLYVDGSAAGTINALNGTGSNYTVDITGVSGDGDLRLDLTDGSGISDVGTGTQNPLPTSGTLITIDNTGPTVILITNVPDPTGTNPVPVKAQFSEAVTGFDLTDVTEGADVTAQNLNAQSALVYIFELNRTAGNGVVSANVNAAAAVDAAGNPSTISNVLSTNFDSGVTDPANLFNSSAIYVTGDNPPLDGFSPGSDPLSQIRDDGTNGDVAAGDGLWSLSMVISEGDGATRKQWKVASPTFSPVSIPASDNSIFRPTGTATTTFYMDTNTQGDGFIPDPDGSTTLAYLYTDPAVMLAADTIRATGNFLSEIGGNDWDATDNSAALLDDGLNGDTAAGDDIYAVQFTGVPPGPYEFKITANGSFDLAAGDQGYSSGGGNLSFTVIDITDTITITFDSLHGRTKIDNDNSSANPGPPFFGTSDAWSTVLDASTMLFDDGTNGDVVSGDGIYAREFTVTNGTSGNIRAVQVRQFVGPTFPGTGNGYPFTANTGQNVLVQFDTNTYTDGFSPATRFIWTDPASRRFPSYVQVVGDFMIDLGGAGNWDAGNTQFQLVDGGANGDVSSGDNIYAQTFASPALSNKVYKAVGEQGNFDYQFGGTGDGYTWMGNNPGVALNIAAGNIIFQVDASTGRVGTGAAAPDRPATLDTPASESPLLKANFWQFYSE